MDSPKVHRRLARRRALQCIFALDFQKVKSVEQVRRTFWALPEDDDEDAFDHTEPSSKPTSASFDDSTSTAIPVEDQEFALQLVSGAFAHLDEIDGVIRRFSRHWKIERIAKAELSVLRLAVYELLYEPEIPLRVSINEAIELSKEFADDHSFPFVNGILDAVAKAVSHGELGIPQQF